MKALTWAGRPAIAFGVVGTLAGLLVFAVLGSAQGTGWSAVPPTAGLCSALCTAFIWPRFFRRRSPTAGRGALAGTVIALVVYPVVWYVLIVSYWLTSFGTPEHHDRIPPWTGVPAAFVYAAWGILLTGWITLPIAAIAGSLFAVLEKRRTAPA